MTNMRYVHNIHNILSSRRRGWSLLQHAKISWKMHLFGTFRMEAMTILDAGNMATFETLKDYEWFSDEILSHLLDLGGGGGPGQGQPGPPPRCLPNALPRRQPLCQGNNFGLIVTFHILDIYFIDYNRPSIFKEEMGFGSFPAYDKLPYEKRIPGKGSRQKMVYFRT